jgi:hypothetical protein
MLTREQLLSKWANEIEAAELVPGEMDGTAGYLYALALELDEIKADAE